MYNALEFLAHSDFWQISIALPVLIAYLILTRLVVFPWQVVGLLRCCEGHFIDHGQTLRIRSIQGLVIVVIIMNAVGVVDTLHWYMVSQRQALDAASISKTKNYTLSLREDRSTIYLNGSFDFGITNNLEAMLIDNPGVSGIVLSSTGGFVSEGRGVFRLIDQYKLDTFVYGECSSACALAFIAGNNRYMATNARLGFHQYSLELQTAFQPVDLVEEQEQDLKLLRNKQISNHFLQQVFKQPSQSIWFPTFEVLLESGVISSPIVIQNKNHGTNN